MMGAFNGSDTNVLGVKGANTGSDDGVLGQRTKHAVKKMKTRYWLALAGLSGVLVGWQEPAQARSIPLPNGQFALTTSGSFAVCLDPTSFAEEACTTQGAKAFPITGLSNGVAVTDREGRVHCDTVVNSNADFPSDASPPSVSTSEHLVANVTTYDPSTGTGDYAVTGYVGGTCNGSSFDASGATKDFTSTAHFVVSQQGKRVDILTTGLTNPNNSIGAFSISGVLLKQLSSGDEK
jgi:hypothetical protein